MASRQKNKKFVTRGRVIVLFALCTFGLVRLGLSFAEGPTSIRSVDKLSAVKNTTAPQPLFRDGGSSVRLGNKILWLFGDTLFTEKSVDGTNGRSNTAAWADITQPYRLSEPLDAKGAPSQFIPFNTKEAAYNAASTDPNDRYVIWPTQAINIDENTAYIYYLRLKSSPNPTTLVKKGIGIASVSTNSTAARVVNESVFSESDAQFRPTAVRGSFVYLQDCRQNGFVSDCAVARVQKSQMAIRSAYDFWDGSTWQKNIGRAAYSIPGSPSTMAITWNAYSQKFLMLSAPAFSRDLTLRTADEIQGPWSAPKLAYTDTTSKFPSILYFHDELSSNSGQSIVFTATQNYNSFNEGDGIFAFRINFDNKSVVTNPNVGGTIGAKPTTPQNSKNAPTASLNDSEALAKNTVSPNNADSSLPVMGLEPRRQYPPVYMFLGVACVAGVAVIGRFAYRRRKLKKSNN